MRHVQEDDLANATAVPLTSSPDAITEDLRSFALELGVSGASALSKEELVESLRQVYVLRTVLESASNGRASGLS
ncbi:hypothetical protein SLNSH_10145 [Alsobacter soli]|uniref:Uncharacterized protein n=1 Tax=Alsobacter soli TaxID=2109933 RepID=A0A2T1HU39_9HYPH|nr:hypothetical protein [Alsobacter soli]PSC05166.1 hypothetical protein SLNSH_10145 [Alsobacter soli]